MKKIEIHLVSTFFIENIRMKCKYSWFWNLLKLYENNWKCYFLLKIVTTNGNDFDIFLKGSKEKRNISHVHIFLLKMLKTNGHIGDCDIFYWKCWIKKEIYLVVILSLSIVEIKWKYGWFWYFLLKKLKSNGNIDYLIFSIANVEI